MYDKRWQIRRQRIDEFHFLRSFEVRSSFEAALLSCKGPKQRIGEKKRVPLRRDSTKEEEPKTMGKKTKKSKFRFRFRPQQDRTAGVETKCSMIVLAAKATLYTELDPGT